MKWSCGVINELEMLFLEKKKSQRRPFSPSKVHVFSSSFYNGQSPHEDPGNQARSTTDCKKIELELGDDDRILA